MRLTVYQLEHSPYCIPITRALGALGLSFETRNVSNGDRREVIEITKGAYYQVPVLAHDENVIFESSPSSIDVARYIDRTFAGGRLFPADWEGLQRITIPYIEDNVESVTFKLVDPLYLRDIADYLERAMIRRHKERKFGHGCEERWTQERPALRAEAERLLSPFDIALTHKPFLFGDVPIFSDFALFGVLGNLTYRNYNTIPDSLTKLGAWFERMRGFTYDAAPN
ncbi:MAG TPA: glutathione S-transferase family protein [Terrimicrobiaceae bacterium]